VQTLSLALQNRGEEGEPLPSVFQQLDALGVKFRRGWLHLIAGAAGGGKSAISSFMALNMDYSHGHGTGRVPTLYFSADNDKLTFGCAAVAAAMDIHTNQAEKLLEIGDPEAFALLEELTAHLWVSFEPSPTPLDIREEIDAFATVYGDWPHVVVIDNLMDVDASGGGIDERSSQNAILDFLKRLARETGAAVIVLCHVTGEHADGTAPIPRSGLMNKIDKPPQVVLTLHQIDTNLLGVSVVKNRRGRAKTDGTLIAEIPWMPELAYFHTGSDNNG